MAIKIFIDQGHNPENPNAGAEGNGYREQDLVYYIGKELEALLNANPNFEARTSRNSPDEILGTSIASSLAARANAANSWPADYFISIHANASEIASASGSEAFVYSLSSPAFGLAENILIGLSEATRSFRPRRDRASDALCSAENDDAGAAAGGWLYHERQ